MFIYNQLSFSSHNQWGCSSSFLSRKLGFWGKIVSPSIFFLADFSQSHCHTLLLKSKQNYTSKGFALVTEPFFFFKLSQFSHTPVTKHPP